MSDDSFTTRLSRFTPNVGDLDRDALLFAAGRASALPRRRWIALACALAAGQLLTLGVFLWPRHTLETPGPLREAAPILATEPQPPSAPEVPELWLLREQVLATEGKLPVRVPFEPLVPSEPPLRAFGAPPAALFN